MAKDPKSCNVWHKTQKRHTRTRTHTKTSGCKMMKTECFCKARETASKVKTEYRWGESICSMINFFLS